MAGRLQKEKMKKRFHTYIREIGKETTPDFRTNIEFKETVATDAVEKLMDICKECRRLALAEPVHRITAKIAEQAVITTQSSAGYEKIVRGYLKEGKKALKKYRQFEKRPVGSPRMSNFEKTGQFIPVYMVKKFMKAECNPCSIEGDAAAFIAGVIHKHIADVFLLCNKYLKTLLKSKRAKTLNMNILSESYQMLMDKMNEEFKK